MTTQAMDQLSSFLDGLIASARNLDALLSEESAILETRSPEELETITQTKTHLVSELESAEKVLRKFTGAKSAAGASFTWHDFVEQVDPQRQYGVAAKVEELKTILLHCQRANEINGAVVMAKKRFTEDLTAILHGRPPNQAAETYGKRGQKCHQESSTTLTTA